MVFDISRIEEKGLAIPSPGEFQEFGRDVCGLGDLNGDGFEELGLFGGHEPADHGFILRGGPQVPAHPDPGEWQAWGCRIESPTGHSACVPVPVGDLNRDGLEDVAFTFWTDDTQVAGFRILFGSDPLPSAIDPGTIGSTLPGMVIYADPKAHYVSGHAALQGIVGLDANGDGWQDLAISASSVEEASGGAYLIFGGASLPGVIHLTTDGSAFGGTYLHATNPFNIDQWRSQSLGYSIASARDLDHDGYDDLLVSAPGWDLEGERTEVGAVFLILGRPDFPAEMDIGLQPQGTCRFLGADPRTLLGTWKAYEAGDLNGDGFGDLAFNDGGRVYIVFGRKSFPQQMTLDGQAADVLLIFEPWASHQTFASGLGDFNGDGFADLAVVAPKQTTARWGYGGMGVAYVVYGRPDMEGTIAVGEPARHTLLIPSRQADEGLGGVAGAGQVALAGCDSNGDGLQDLAVGAPSNRPGLPHREPSRLYLLYGAPDHREALAAYESSPKEGDIAGGADVQIRGEGFTSTTMVYFDDSPAAQCQRIDSRTLLVRTPPFPLEAMGRVSLRDGDRTATFTDPFRYGRYAIPPRVRLDELGTGGTIIVNDPYLNDNDLPFEAAKAHII